MFARASRTSLIAFALASASALVPVSAHAAITSTVVGTSATIVGDATPEVLVLDQTGGNLRHNRAGDGGFNSAIDFDSATGGDQTIPANQLSSLDIKLGAGPNSLVVDESLSAVAATWSLGNSSLVTPLAGITYDASLSSITVKGGTLTDTFLVLSSAAATPFTIESGASADNVTVGSAAGTLTPILGAVKLSGGASADTLTVNDSTGTDKGSYSANQEPGRTTLSRDGVGTISWDASLAVANLRAGVSDDTVTLLAPPATATVLNLDLGRGNDSFKPNGVTNLGGGTIVGGTGLDTVDFSGQTSGVNVNFTTGTPGAYGVASEIEAITGTPSDDTIVGSAGDESINGRDGKDSISGGAGDDTISMASITGGVDTVFGGAGIDTFDYSTLEVDSVVTLDGAPNDSIAGKTTNVAEIEVLRAGYGMNTLTGSAANETIVGGGGADVIDGGAGNDTLEGNGGFNTYRMGAAADGSDVVIGNYNDLVDYSKRAKAVAVTLADEISNDGEKGEGDSLRDVTTVLGGKGNDSMTGSRFANRLVGGAGNDKLSGGAGNDTLDGGAGNDVLTGGLGKDTLLGGAGNDKLAAKAGPKDKDAKIDGGAGKDTATLDKVDKAIRVP